MLVLKKIVIFGNSGSGKSTLAKQLSTRESLAHLDLDTLAWLPQSPPERAPIAESRTRIQTFIDANTSWVIEGCYADLLAVAIENANEIVFMNLPVELCVANARHRPWEPHKYASKAAQDANLDMLLDWIAQYPTRKDEFSETAHQKLYAAFSGTKHMRTTNQQSA